MTEINLVYNYAVMRCKESQFLALDPSDIIAYRKRDFQIDVLVDNGKEAQRKYKGAVVILMRKFFRFLCLYWGFLLLQLSASRFLLATFC